MFKSFKRETEEERAEEELPWRQALDKVDSVELWDGKNREERTPWSGYLLEADKILKRPRRSIPKEIVKSVLEGNLTGLDLSSLPTAQPKVVIFVSSTFTDTKAERNHLMKDVYPFLRSLCRRLGVDFGTVDMRWGVTEEATFEHSTVDMCVNEIERCIKDSVGPAFLCLLGQKYGLRPLPAQIEQAEFDEMLGYLEKSIHDTKLIKDYYTIDHNAIPSEYVLKPRTKEISTWWEDYEKLQEQTREAAVACFGKDNEKCDKYHISVTETEINHGAFQHPTNKDQTYFIRRDLEKFSSDFHKDRKIADHVNGQLDEYAQEMLDELKDKKVPSFKPSNLLEVKYELAATSHITKHLKRVCDYVCKTMADGILASYEKRLHYEEDRVCQEVLQHTSHAMEKTTLFVGREQEIRTIMEYIRSDDKKPLVVHGQSGCGKTALMAVVAKKVKDAIDHGVVALRFLGTTGHSGSARLLLLNLCNQISRIYDKDLSLIPTSYKELIAYFRTCLGYATSNKPLTVLLDSLDQLTNEDFGQNLAWLSLSEELPAHVKIVVSSLPTQSLQILKSHLKTSVFVEVKQLTLDEGPEIVKKMLEANKRRVIDQQMKLIMESFKKCPLPLFLRLVVDIALRWKSFDKIDASALASDIPGLITMLFNRLESRYGEKLVQHALGYITAAKNGLSLAELEDILSCDDDVLDSVFQWWTPPIRRIPPLLWARIRNELGIYLAERGTDGVSAYNWYHRQFWETAEKRYLADDKLVRKTHGSIASYFEGKWSNGKPYSGKDGILKTEDRKIPKQSLIVGGDRSTKRQLNRRKLTELPYHLIRLKEWGRFKLLVMDLEYIEAKFEAGDGYNCLSELIEAAKLSGIEEFTTITRFVGSNLGLLIGEPEGIYQMASQGTKNSLVRGLLDRVPAKGRPISLMVNMFESEFSDPCEMTLHGHTTTIRCCDYSPKGDLLLSSSDDSTMRLWDATTGAEVVTVTSLPAPVFPGPEEGQQLMLHPVNPCCFSPAGDKIASGTEIGEVMLWDLSGVQICKQESDNKAVVYIQFSPDGKHIATAFKNSLVIIWNAENLDEVADIPIGWSGDSSDLKHIAPEDDSKGRRRGARRRNTVVKGWSECTGMDYSKDGKNIAVICNKGLVLIDTSDFSIRSMTTGQCYQNLCCAYHPNGTQIMSGGDDSCVSIWNNSDGQFVTRLRQHNAWIWSIRFTQDGKHMCTCSSDRTMKVWAAEDNGSWNVIATVGGHSHRVSMVSIEPGRERKMVTSSLDSTLKVWNIEAVLKGEVLPVGGMHYLVCTASPDGRYLASSQGWLRLCNIYNAGDHEGGVIMQSPTHQGFVKMAQFSADSSRLYVLDHGHTGAYEYGAEKKAQVTSFNIENGSSTVVPVSSPTAFAIGSQYLIVGTFEGKLKLFDTSSLDTEIHEWAFGGDEQIGYIAHCSKTNLVAACVNKLCKIWIINSDKTTTHVADLTEHEAGITVMAFSPDGKYLVVGDGSGKLHIWTMEKKSAKLFGIKTEHTSYIKDIVFSTSGNYMVTSAGSNMRVWDAQNGMSLFCTYYAPVNCATFLDESVVIAGEATGNKTYLRFRNFT